MAFAAVVVVAAVAAAAVEFVPRDKDLQQQAVVEDYMHRRSVVAGCWP